MAAGGPTRAPPSCTPPEPDPRRSRTWPLVSQSVGQREEPLRSVHSQAQPRASRASPLGVLASPLLSSPLDPTAHAAPPRHYARADSSGRSASLTIERGSSERLLAHYKLLPATRWRCERRLAAQEERTCFSPLLPARGSQRAPAQSLLGGRRGSERGGSPRGGARAPRHPGFSRLPPGSGSLFSRRGRPLSNLAGQVIQQLTGSGRAGVGARSSTRRGKSSPGCRPKTASKSFPRECKSWKKRAASLEGLAGRWECACAVATCPPGLPGSNLGPTSSSAGVAISARTGCPLGCSHLHTCQGMTLLAHWAWC